MDGRECNGVVSGRGGMVVGEGKGEGVGVGQGVGVERCVVQEFSWWGGSG